MSCNKTIVTATKVTSQVVTATPTKTLLTAGFRGSSGVDGDRHFVHNQGGANALWTITHNLGKYPAVSVVDSAGSLVEGDVSYVSINVLTVEFSSAFSGVAYLN